MKTYRIYVSSVRSPSLVAVKIGFSWPAFIIGPLWFLLNRMWLTFLLFVALDYGSLMVLESLEDPKTGGQAAFSLFLFAVVLAVWFLSGSLANYLLGEELLHRGYKMVSPINAKSSGEAIDSFAREGALGRRALPPSPEPAARRG